MSRTAVNRFKSLTTNADCPWSVVMLSCDSTLWTFTHTMIYIHTIRKTSIMLVMLTQTETVAAELTIGYQYCLSIARRLLRVQAYSTIRVRIISSLNRFIAQFVEQLSFVIVISEFLERHSQAKRTRAPAYLLGLRQIKGVVQRVVHGEFRSDFQRVRGAISKGSDDIEQVLRWVSFRLGGWMIR